MLSREAQTGHTPIALRNTRLVRCHQAGGPRLRAHSTSVRAPRAAQSSSGPPRGKLRVLSDCAMRGATRRPARPPPPPHGPASAPAARRRRSASRMAWVCSWVCSWSAVACACARLPLELLPLGVVELGAQPLPLRRRAAARHAAAARRCAPATREEEGQGDGAGAAAVLVGGVSDEGTACGAGRGGGPPCPQSPPAPFGTKGRRVPARARDPVASARAPPAGASRAPPTARPRCRAGRGLPPARVGSRRIQLALQLKALALCRGRGQGGGGAEGGRREVGGWDEDS